MFSFRELELSDRDWITACRDPKLHPYTSLSFTSLFTWRKAYGLTVAGDPDFFVVHSRHDRAFYGPCGDREKSLRFMLDAARAESGARFLYLTKDQSLALREEGFHSLLRDDLSEYICDLDSLALREGHHASNSYKMKVRHFLKEIPCAPRPVTRADLPLLAEIAAAAAPVKDAHDGDVLRTELDRFEELGLSGCLLETEDGRRAFILGYPDIQDIFTMTMTRHEAGLPAQVTAVLMHAFSLQLSGQYRFVNLEEDLGLAGLRRAKLLYSPVDRLNVYEAIR